MKKTYTILLVGLIILSIILFYINLNNPIRIALIGNFEEERYYFDTSSIIAGRIAEENINKSDGIRGRMIELVAKEDAFQDIEETIKFLKKNKIEVVITTATSSDLVKIKSQLEENKIVCISVGATADSLSRQNDYIYRVLPDDEKEIKALFDYFSERNISKDIALIYDNSNIEYKKSVESVIKKLGGDVVFQESWSEDSFNYVPSNLEALQDRPILILSPPRHTAIIIQKLNSYGITDKLFGTSWSGDDYLLEYGGRAVEGFTFVAPVDFSNDDKDSMELSNSLEVFRKKNGLVPNGIYKGLKLIKKTYEYRHDKHSTLKEAFDNNGYFDVYGDSKEEEFIFTVNNGIFTKIKGGSYGGTKN